MGTLTQRESHSDTIWGPSTSLPYMVQLDALRAFAVLGVLASHFTLYTRSSPGVIQAIDLAGFGVRLFFVLSGFLITGILLRSKTYCEEHGSSAWYELRQFYVRRFLRIFPLFYLVIGVAILLDISPMRQSWPWHVTYLTNFFLFSRGWDGSINHFWSLAVEEQFYLAWPWIVLFVERKKLSALIVFGIALAPLFRLVCGAYTGNDRTPILPLSCLDTLGVGALLALRREGLEPGHASQGYPLGFVGLLAGFVLATIFLIFCVLNTQRLVRLIIFDTAAALLCGWLVWSASYGFKGLFGRLLELRPLVYIGTVSYGIYMYHNFVPHVLYEMIQLPSASFRLTTPFSWICDSLFLATATLCIAALSWHLFEHPINSLKYSFRHRR